MRKEWVGFSQLRKRFMKKRVSNIRKYCAVHGPFVGFAWGGHRRVCQGKEISEAQWYASLKPREQKAAEAKPPVEGAEVQPAPEMVPTKNGKYPAPPISAMVKIIHGLRDTIFDLDSEITRLSTLIKGAQEKLVSLKTEREKIREAVKSLQK